MPTKLKQFIFGDSITYGEWDSQGGWANRLRNYLDAQVLPQPDDYIISYNLGIPGDTSTGVLNRFLGEVQARLLTPDDVKMQFVFAIGANDARWLSEEQRRGVDIETFSVNLKQITLLARRFSEDINFVGLLPCDEAEAFRAAIKHDWTESYDNATLRLYNDAIKKHCHDTGVWFIDVYSAFIDHHYPDLLSDGLHPNDQGHALIFNSVMQALSLDKP